MYKLSNLDKCWLVANIEKITGPIIFIFVLLPFATSVNWEVSINEFISSIGLVGLVIIIVAAVYAHRIANKISDFASENFQEVVSRRTKWKSSNVELHEMKYKFVLMVYGCIFFSIVTPIFSIVFLIGRSLHTLFFK